MQKNYEYIKIRYTKTKPEKKEKALSFMGILIPKLYSKFPVGLDRNNCIFYGLKRRCPVKSS